MLPVPSKLTPEATTSPARAIVRPVAKAVAVDALPVKEAVTVPNSTSSVVPTA